MEREVHRLERLIADKDNTIKQLNQAIKNLQKNLSAANKQIQILKDKAMSTFSYNSVPDRQIINTMQAKLATSAWQILQLQKTNSRYEENILKLQSDLLTLQQQLAVSKLQICESTMAPTLQITNQSQIQQVFEQWELTIKQKQSLVEQNYQLKQNLKNKQSEISQKIAFYLNEVHNLSAKIKNQHQQEKARLNEFESVVKQLRKQNQELRDTLKKKNEQILIFYEQTKLISTTKAADLHTIRNLRAQMKRRGDQYFKILSKLQQTQQLKKILEQYNASCSQYMGQFNRLSQNLENTKKQNGILKQKLIIEEKKVLATQQIIEEANKKLYQLLVENQACHQLLFETRGFSNLFMKDVEAKIQRFLNNLEKRRQHCDSWLDVSELIQVNQKLRTKAIFQDQ